MKIVKSHKTISERDQHNRFSTQRQNRQMMGEWFTKELDFIAF